jgi:hypothetical protein
MLPLLHRAGSIGINFYEQYASMEVSYTNLVGPRGEKVEATKPFWSFSLFTSKWEVYMSFPRELCTYGGCSKGGSMDTMLLGGMQ